MKPFRSASSFVVTLLVPALTAMTNAANPAPEDGPSRPPHGALSSVTARNRVPTPPASVPAVPPIPREVIEGYVSVGFDQLAGFPFIAPPIQTAGASAPAAKPEVMAQVPASVKKLDDQKVIITGFMMPVKIEKGLATEFMLLNSPLLCCFGVTPSTNAWIVVKMPRGVPPIQDVPT